MLIVKTVAPGSGGDDDDAGSSGGDTVTAALSSRGATVAAAATASFSRKFPSQEEPLLHCLPQAGEDRPLSPPAAAAKEEEEEEALLCSALDSFAEEQQPHKELSMCSSGEEAP